MAKSRRGTKKTGRASEPVPEVPVDPRVYSDEAAETVFTELPPRLDETLAVVRYTGRKRAYIHYGRAGDGTVFWYLIRSDGPRLLKIYPSERATECFDELLMMMQSWRESVNSDPMSPSYCDICPEEAAIIQNIRARYLGLEG